MSEQPLHDLVIYRMNATELEVFMVNHPENEGLKMPSGAFETLGGRPFIQLESVETANGEQRRAIAVEADWHEIPSLRALIREDYEVAKGKLKTKIKGFFPSMEQGAYVAAKDVMKKIAPVEYQFLKELKDILLEKNAVSYL